MTWSFPEISFSCTFLGFPFTCRYEALSVSVGVKGSDTSPGMVLSNAPLTGLGDPSVCGTKADWTATYNITSPSSIFIE
jgi:hypothetical protein